MNIWLAVGAALGAIVVCLSLGSGVFPVSGRPPPRLVALVGTVLTGAVCAVVLVVMQLLASGEVTYYGQKFILAVETVALALIAVALAHVGVNRHSRRWSRPWLRAPAALVCVLVTLAATQAFGPTFAEVPGPDAAREFRTAAPAGLVARAGALAHPHPAGDRRPRRPDHRRGR